MSSPRNRAAFYCTNIAFLTSQIPLASFVPKKKQPYQDVQSPYTVPPEAFTARRDEAFSADENMSSGGLLSILATRFASVSHQRSKATSINMSAADGGNVYTINSPDDVFEDIVFGEKHGPYMQAWFERCERRKWNPRFVVGLRTFYDASVETEAKKTGKDAASMQVPISSAVGDATGAADVSFNAARNNDADAGSAMTLPGERIYAICYWKIKILKRGGKITPELKSQKNVWRAVEDTRGADEEDDSGEEGNESDDGDVYQANLEGNDEDTAGWEVLDAGVEGNIVRLAFLINEDSDSEAEKA